jgi:hypothetical protein
MIHMMSLIVICAFKEVVVAVVCKCGVELELSELCLRRGILAVGALLSPM